MISLKSFLVSTVATILFWAPSGGANHSVVRADELKPISVVSIASYDHLRGDVGAVGEISGNPGLGQGLDGLVAFVTNFQGLAGLDKTRPLGAAVLTDGEQYHPLAFVPVTSTKELLGVLSGLVGQPEELGENRWKLVRPRVTLYIQEQKGWAFLAMREADLDALPHDPLKLIGNLPETYDLAARVHVQNIPIRLREQAVDQFQQYLRHRLDRDPVGEGAEPSDRSHRAVRGLKTAFAEIDQITLGLAFDAEGHRALFDVAVAVISDGKLSQHFEQVRNHPATSKMVGFLLPDALFRLHLNSTATEDDIQAMLAVVDQAHEELLANIDRDQDLPDDQKDTVKKLVDDTHQVVVATLRKGRFNGGIAVTGQGPFHAAVGIGVSDGKKLEAVLKQLLSMAMAGDLGPEPPNFPEIKFDVAEHRGIHMHVLTAPIPEEEVEQRQVLGDEVVITLGFGAESVYVALGDRGEAMIKEILDKSAAASAEADKALPLELSLGLERILKFASQQEPDDRVLRKVVESLNHSGQDRIKFSTRLIDNGVLARLEVEEGILRLLGTATRAHMEADAP